MKRKEVIKMIMNTKGDIGELRGLLALARSQGLKRVIIKIPVRLFAIDPAYQTDIRTRRELGYLVNNWDERKLLPLLVVPHDEEGKFYVVDGYGRWIASQMLENPYETLECLVLLDVPKEKEERRKYEAELFAFQNVGVAKVTPLQRHGSLRILGDKTVLAMDELQEKYKFEYISIKGQRSESVLGSYSECINICSTKGKDCLDYIFSILRDAGFDRKANGYASYIMRMLRDAWILYTDNRTETKKFLGDYLRSYSPEIFRAKATAKYPMLDTRTACSLYVEDMIVDNLGLEQTREVSGTRLVPIKRTEKAAV